MFSTSIIRCNQSIDQKAARENQAADKDNQDDDHFRGACRRFCFQKCTFNMDTFINSSFNHARIVIMKRT
jgi:hypothetical protein